MNDGREIREMEEVNSFWKLYLYGGVISWWLNQKIVSNWRDMQTKKKIVSIYKLNFYSIFSFSYELKIRILEFIISTRIIY